MDGRQRNLALLCTVLFTTACDPIYEVEVDVQIAPPTDAPLVVQLVPFSTVGADGLPDVLPNDVRRGLVIAASMAGSQVNAIHSRIGCPTDVRVLAWVDVDGSSGFEAAEFRDDGFADDDDAPDLQRFLDARPNDADWLAVSEPIHDPDCKHDDPFLISLSLSPD